MTERPAAFVLVHGAWHGGWCWFRVAEILRRQGHRVFTPTLTGLGERSRLATQGAVNCSTHVRDILDVIHWERLDRVVLCGHSYGGLVVGAVADALPDRVASLVYLDAAVPEDGKSMLDQLEPEMVKLFLDSAAQNGGLAIPPLPATAFNVNPADREMVDALCTPQPFATLAERLRLTGAYRQVRKTTCIIATDWPRPEAALQAQRARAQAFPDWTMVEIAAGHDLMLDAPQAVADALIDAI